MKQWKLSNSKILLKQLNNKKQNLTEYYVYML